MNCCNEYGNCRQGRDCPARIEVTDAEYKDRLDNALGIVLWALGLVVGVLGYMAVAS